MRANEQVLTNARLVLDNDIVRGSLVIQAGRIKAIDQGATALPNAIDCEGDLLIPGLIELHTDNMEKYFQPRPKVSWPSRSPERKATPAR